MRYERDTIVRLRERYARLVKAGFRTYDAEVRYLRDFIRATPSLSAIVTLLELAEPDLDPDQWVSEHFSDRDFLLPPTEYGRCKVCWRVIGRWADGENPINLASEMSSERNFDQMLREAT